MKQRRSNIDFSRYAVAAAALGGIAAVENADADFIPPYALNPPPNGPYTGTNAVGTFGNWTSTLTFTTNASPTLTTNQPTSVALALQNFALPSTTDNFDLRATVAGTGTVSFSWSFTDSDFLPNNSSFGYTINGVFTQLAANTTQSGNATTPALSAGDIFGFRLATNYGGNSSVTITNFAAPIPEPSVTMLVASGAVGLLAMRAVRRRKLARR
jgi:hypothetical protein